MTVSVLSDSRIQSAKQHHGWTNAEVLELAARVPRKMMCALVWENIRLADLPYVDDTWLEALRNVGPRMVRELRASVPYEGPRPVVPQVERPKPADLETRVANLERALAQVGFILADFVRSDD